MYKVCFSIYVFAYLLQVFLKNTLEFSDFLRKARVSSNLKSDGAWFFEKKRLSGVCWPKGTQNFIFQVL